VYAVMRTDGQWLQCWRAAVRLPPLYFCNNVNMHLLKRCLGPCVNCQHEVRLSRAACHSALLSFLFSLRHLFNISPASCVVTLLTLLRFHPSGTVPIHTLLHSQTVYFNLKMSRSCTISAARKSQT
jgi:hypothetical protein